MPTSIPPRMRAAVITRPGGPEVLEVHDVPTPVPGLEHVLVRVHASALNRADLAQREGRYPAPPGSPADVPGLEVAGEIAAVGPGASLWTPGDRVFGIVGGGGNAQYLAVHERTLSAMPSALSWTDGAAVPEAFITAHDAMITQAGARLSERVLIHAVGSGVGLAAVQLARAVGAIPYGTARTADKIERARAYGLEDGVAVGDDLDLINDAVARWSDGRGMDVILDLVGGPYLPVGVRSAALGARMLLIGTVAGGAAPLPIGVVMGKRMTIRGTVLRARPLEEKIAATRAFASQVVPLLARRVVRPVVDTVLPLAEIRAAHELMASNRTFGKIVLEIAH